ncbi:hypothetical protein [Flavobacterium sp.]|uniref:hypothetical protein n=1 Tax=Flavobacterium sp. TaxID=239 RepID=UPI00260FF3DD|nr:hypothetical protein [Flavobacterium sp.]
MYMSKNKHTNKNSGIALLFLFVFFHFLLYSAFSSIPVFSSSKLEKENLVQISTKSDHSKYSKIHIPTSDMEEEFEYSEVEIDPFLHSPIQLFDFNTPNATFVAVQSKYHKSYFYKKSGLFLLFCKLKYHLS